MPGINIGSGGAPGQTTITLRGIAPVGPGSVVGTYIDDTPLGASNNFARATFFALDMMPYDVERIEVLRGPQGTLYGAGSMGGLLKYVMRDPSTEALEFRAGLEGFDIAGAEDAGWGARAGENVPLGSTVALRASYFSQNTPGYIDNVGSGDRDENELEQSGGRASLLWKPSDAVELTVGGLGQRLDSDNNASMALELTAIDPPRGRRRYVDERQSEVVTLTDNLSYVLPEYDVVDLNADIQFDAMTVRVFVKNVTDERAFTGGGTTVDGLNVPVRLDLNVLQPRTVGLSVDVQF
jgi:iron complex outermembrane recepter protein